MTQRARWALSCSLLVPILAAAQPQPPVVVPVAVLPAAPVVDGKLGEWGREGWTKLQVAPAVAKQDREKFGLEGEDRNATGTLTLELKATVAQGRLFVALRWPDDAADLEYKGWDWSGSRYVEGRRRDDMLAMRFHIDGEFDRSMLAGKNYRADVWLWSAARTNPAGLAEDWLHLISSKPIENAAEYEVKGVGTVYIKKIRDAGNPIYKFVRAPKDKTSERLPFFEMVPSPSGSVADVAAKGVWSSGFWNLELSRKLDTGNADDAGFKPGQKQLGQIAVFNRGSDENKSVSEPFLLDLPSAR